MHCYLQPASSSQTNFPQVEGFYGYWFVSYPPIRSSQLLKLDHPFSSHQYCFGNKLSSQMGAVVHTEKKWKKMNWSTSQINLLL